jgi:hypothetical protein
VTEFIKKGLEGIDYLQHLPDTQAIQTQLRDLRDSFVTQQNILKYHPERAYEESFAASIEAITNDLAQIAGLLPDFATSQMYQSFCEAAFQAGLVLAGLPFVPQRQLEADSW